MSHFSQVKTQVSNRKDLETALKKLGYTVVDGEQGCIVRGFMGETQKAEFKILTDSHYDIGFEKDEAGNYSLVGDWELLPKVSGLTQDGFLTQVKREYARASILRTAAEQGYEVQVEEKEGSIEMVVTQW